MSFCCDHQDGKADVILRYNPDEARNLKAYGELPDHGTVHSIAVGKYVFYMNEGVLLILFASLIDKNVELSHNCQQGLPICQTSIFYVKIFKMTCKCSVSYKQNTKSYKTIAVCVCS